MDLRDERKQTTDEASKVDDSIKTNIHQLYWDKLTDSSRGLRKWCSALMWHDLGTGFWAEQWEPLI